MKRHLMRILLVGAAALVPTAGLHAETLTSDGKACDNGPAPAAARTVTVAQLKAMAQSLGQSLMEFHGDLVRTLVAEQLTLIAGHSAPPSNTSQPPSTPTPPSGGNGVPPPPPGNGPPPPPPPPPPTTTPPGNTPPPPPNNTPPPPSTPPPPTTTGGPGPVNQTPEPASVVTALIGAGIASVAAWRRRQRKQRDEASA